MCEADEEKHISNCGWVPMEGGNFDRYSKIQFLRNPPVSDQRKKEARLSDHFP